MESKLTCCLLGDTDDHRRAEVCGGEQWERGTLAWEITMGLETGASHLLQPRFCRQSAGGAGQCERVGPAIVELLQRGDGRGDDRISPLLSSVGSRAETNEYRANSSPHTTPTSSTVMRPLPSRPSSPWSVGQGPGYVAAEVTGMNREYMSPRSVESKLRTERSSPRGEEGRRGQERRVEGSKEDDFSPWSSREHLEKEEEAIEVFKEKLDQVFGELEMERRRIEELEKEKNANMSKIQAQAATIRSLKGDKENLTKRMEKLQADARDQEVMTSKMKDVEMQLEGSKRQSADLTRKLVTLALTAFAGCHLYQQEDAEKRLLLMSGQSVQVRDVQRQVNNC
eukprot:755694-Hanusia_phi.AAC.2